MYNFARTKGAKDKKPRRKRGRAVFFEGRRTPILVSAENRSQAISKARKLKRRGGDKVSEVRTLSSKEESQAQKGKWLRIRPKDFTSDTRGYGPKPKNFSSYDFSTSEKTNPALWEKAKSEAKAKMGGKHSGRAMQLAVQIYKKKGGGYKGKKSKSNSLRKWTKEDWGYSSDKSKGKGRYRPKKVWDKLTQKEKDSLNRSKYQGTKKGKQFVPLPKKLKDKAKVPN